MSGAFNWPQILEEPLPVVFKLFSTVDTINREADK